MPNALLSELALQYPIIQAPMAGTSTVALAAAVSNAGGLGSLGLGNCNVEQAREQIQQLQQATTKPFNVNFFCHQPALSDPAREQEWLTLLQPYFAEFSAQPPSHMSAGVPSFIDNPAMLEMLLEERPPVVSFHFGLPSTAVIQALKQAGIKLLGCATNVTEAQAICAAGLHGVIAQGHEAGGHRGVFDLSQDVKLGLFSLLQLLKKECSLPVIAAGGIMHGQAIAQVMAMGASAAQMGTAFILCPESAANQAYREQLKSSRAYNTEVTAVISGRPARGLVNRFHTQLADKQAMLPAYPTTYSAGKALYAAASQQGCYDFAPFWAGQSAPLARELPATELVAQLVAEWQQASTH
jgi:nitronate monooxygenase